MQKNKQKCIVFFKYMKNYQGLEIKMWTDQLAAKTEQSSSVRSAAACQLP